MHQLDAYYPWARRTRCRCTGHILATALDAGVRRGKMPEIMRDVSHFFRQEKTNTVMA